MRTVHAGTGILATVGPTLETKEQFVAAIRAGASNFRLHMGHRDRDHRGDLRRIVAAGAEVGCAVQVLLDFPSSRPRTGRMAPRRIAVGDRLTLVDRAEEDGGDVPLPGLATIVASLEPGVVVGFADGKIRLRLLAVGPGSVEAEVVSLADADFPLKANMAIVVTGRSVRYTMLTEADLDVLATFAAEERPPDWVALSFVCLPEQVDEARALLRERFPAWRPSIMAKIETRAGLDAVDAIAATADGLLVARGDLLSEIAPEELLAAQETIVRAARRHRKKSVVATQFLERFADTGEYNRAELTDIATAARLRPAALMLSKESCFSPRATDCISVMRRIIDREGLAAAAPRFVPRALLRTGRRPYVAIAVEGPNGVGKTTLCARLGAALGAEVRRGVPDAFLGHALKQRMIVEADWRASAFYFIAASIELDRELRDLPEGSVVVLDRSPWSTLAAHFGVDPARVDTVGRAMELVADRLPLPDELLVLTTTYASCRARIEGKTADERCCDDDPEPAFEREQAFYRQVAAGLPRAAVIPTEGHDPDAVFALAIDALHRMRGG